MAVAITCRYGGYLLPLLAAHSSLYIAEIRVAQLALFYAFDTVKQRACREMVRFGWQLYMLYPKIAIKLTLAFKLTTPIATNILSHWLSERQLLTQSLMLHYVNHVSSRFVIQYEWRNALTRITMGPNATIVTGTMNAFNTLRPGALSLTWITFNPSVDK